MTTEFHDPIPSSPKQSANAATFNTRFASLDAGIVAVTDEVEAARNGQSNLNDEVDRIDERISTIIAQSGTSDTEVVDSRGGYTVLSERINDLNLKSNVFYVDAAFEGLTAAGRFTTITAALAACSGGETIHIAPGIYTENLSMADDFVTLMGSGKPKYDSATGRLVNGTIIRGRLRLNATLGTTVAWLGVDSVDVSPSEDCISSSGADYDAYRNFQHLTLLGAGKDAADHGLYLSSRYNKVHDVDVYFCFHGIAVHSSHVTISDCDIYYCYDNGIIVKSKDDLPCIDVKITNCSLIGDKSDPDWRTGPLSIQTSQSQDVRGIRISNVTVINAWNAALYVRRLDATGLLSDVHIVNMSSEDNDNEGGWGDFYFETGDAITLVNCSSKGLDNNFAYRLNSADNVGNVYLRGCLWDGSAGARLGVFKSNEINDVVGGGIYKPYRLSIADDEIIVLDLNDLFFEVTGTVIISENSSSVYAGVVTFRSAASPYCTKLSSGGGSTLTVGTGAITNIATDATDLHITVKSHTDGMLYVANRSGATRTMRLVFFG